jgi:cell division protein FtsB
MSRFNSEIKVLEQQLKKYQKELQQLHDENASLKQREEGLCRSLVTLQVRDMSPALHNVMR